MSDTRVVHVNDNIPGAVYIGRAVPRRKLAASPFGNPFPLASNTRYESLRRYREWVERQLRSGAIDPESVINLRGKPLACWCRHDGITRTGTNTCHGDLIVELLARHTDDDLRALRQEAA